MKKTITEETRIICSLCGGRGAIDSTRNTSGTEFCVWCQGSGQIVTKRVTRREEIDKP